MWWRWCSSRTCWDIEPPFFRTGAKLVVRLENEDSSRYEILDAVPSAMDMRKVSATIEVIERTCAGHIECHPSAIGT